MNGVRVIGECVVYRAIRVANRPAAIEIHGSANMFDDGGHADAVTEQPLLVSLEWWKHERFACYHARIPATSAPLASARDVRILNVR
jgi:hypothetical protein